MGRCVGFSFSFLVVGEGRGGEGRGGDAALGCGWVGLLWVGANGCRKVGMLRIMRRLRIGLRI